MGHPKPVKVGHVTVRLYHYENKGYDEFKVADHSSGKRRFHVFTNLDQAREKANDIANKINGGEVAALTLTGKDQAAYMLSLDRLKPTGTKIEVAAGRYAEAFQILGGDKIIEAAREYANRHRVGIPQKSVAEVVAEMLKHKEQDGVSKVDLRDLDGRLNRFAKDFQIPLMNLTGETVNQWLRGLNLSKRSRRNFGATIKRLVYYAKERRYLARDWDEMEHVKLPKIRRGKVRLFSPMQMAWYLHVAPEVSIAWLAIGAFAGLRTAEIKRLDWSDIDLVNDRIHVRESVSGETDEEDEEYNKTGERWVPIQPNLKAWLKPRAKKSGPVVEHGNITNIAATVGKREHPKLKTKLPWVRNSMRHSYITFRFKVVQNMDTVAEEAGHDYKTCRRYKEQKLQDGTPTNPEMAAQWFAITPANVKSIAMAG